MQPEISIIIPVYNVEKYLERCLDSVLSQTFQDFEVLVVNDGSTDNSLSILEQYASRDSRIEIISQKNQGLSMARNNGLKNVQGNYVCFLDSDDFIDKNFLMELYNEARKADADVVMTSTKYVGNKKFRKDDFAKGAIVPFAEKVSILPHGGCWNKLYKQSFLSKYKLQFPKGLYWEDNIFTIQVCWFSNKLAVINGDDVSYNYVNNPVGITRNPLKEEKRKKDSLVIAEMIMDFIKFQNCNSKDAEIVSNFCLRNFINAKHLLQNDFYNEVKRIVGDSVFLKKIYRKQRKKRIKQKIVHCIKAIINYLKSAKDEGC